ncbi:hypothetical protein OKW50_004367 [Paraburkholderia youngii]|uniref:Uncharacterized protein n=1 Tax=Paraburkholderia youngii TaxID=2782701 RepID=A0A7W8LC42_9BURK|nr:hypothetical protein [Paraburkholderia youngii]
MLALQCLHPANRIKIGTKKRHPLMGAASFAGSAH